MNVVDLSRRIGHLDYVVPPEGDPLRESDVLQEAQLLDVRVEALSSTVGLLFDLRSAMQLVDANTAVLIARGVHEFLWSAEPRLTDKTAWNIVRSEPRTDGALLTFELESIPRSRIRLVAEKAEFYIGDVPGLEAQPSDYEFDDDLTVRANLADWQSSFVPLSATSH